MTAPTTLQKGRGPAEGPSHGGDTSGSFRQPASALSLDSSADAVKLEPLDPPDARPHPLRVQVDPKPKPQGNGSSDLARSAGGPPVGRASGGSGEAPRVRSHRQLLERARELDQVREERHAAELARERGERPKPAWLLRKEKLEPKTLSYVAVAPRERPEAERRGHMVGEWLWGTMQAYTQALCPVEERVCAEAETRIDDLPELPELELEQLAFGPFGTPVSWPDVIHKQAHAVARSSSGNAETSFSAGGEVCSATAGAVPAVPPKPPEQRPGGPGGELERDVFTARAVPGGGCVYEGLGPDGLLYRFYVPPTGQRAEPVSDPAPVVRAKPEVGRAALAEIASSVSRAPARPSWALLGGLRRHSRDRTRRCRVKRIGNVSVQVTSDGGTVTTAGVESCNSVWACPVCAEAIYLGRVDEVTRAIKEWKSRGRGHRVVMITLTVRHERTDDLLRLRRGVANAWRAFWQGRRTKQLRAELGLVHTVRALEPTYGPNGWHPHLHVLAFVEGDWASNDDETAEPTWTDEQIFELRERWADCVERTLGVHRIPTLEHGLQVTISHLSDYICKLGLEVATISHKIGRVPGHRTPWQIAGQAALGDYQSAKLWRSYTDAMLGARQLTWSKNAKKDLKVVERTDAELANSKPERPRVVVTIQGWLWDRLCKIPTWLPAFMAAVRDDPERAEALLPRPLGAATGTDGWYRFDRGS